MNQVTATGKTIEEAIEKALDELQASRDEVEIEILEDPANSISDLRPVEAIIRVTPKIDILPKVLEFVRTLIKKMHILAEVTVKKAPERTIIKIASPDAALLIGKSGQTLDAIQHIVNRYASQLAPDIPLIILDIENYRVQKFDRLEQLAEKAVSKVQQTQKEYILPRMKPQERRFIHKFLGNRDDVITFSRGMEGERRVVVAPVEGKE